ncbi:MltR family transcriptional regulator [Tardiphaga sp. 1201_B9_N1_1]|uniref:MltR family transcriptional regulator n=1 Tax=unclassified Tardiphaga TaxID=2631404 RepID=UPI003F28FEA8
MSKRGDELRRLITEVPPPADVKLIFDRLHTESDRSVALVGASLLETALERLIKHSLARSDPDLMNQLFQQRGPLADFYSKITVASAFGVISANLASDLGIVRNVRNVFAHATTNLSFSTPEITKEIKRSVMLTAVREKADENVPLGGLKFADMTPAREFTLLVHVSFIVLDFDQRDKGGMALME